MIEQANTIVAGDSPDMTKLSQLKISIQEKLETIKLLDGEFLELVPEGELTTEIEQADGFKEGTVFMLLLLE